VNESGLVEVVPYNLLTYSEQFDNANWGGFAVSVTADTSISPSGLLNADTINITSSSGYRRQLVGTLNSSNYTFSAYVKKSANTGTNLFQLYYNNNTVPPNNGQFGAVIDLTNLTITTTPGGTITTGRPTIISSNLTSVGNGWYRAEISFTTGTAAGSTISEIGFQSNGTTAEFLAWGAQLVEGTAALDYLPTTTRLNIPRIDYSTGSAALLVEPQRTNLALYSEQFDHPSWIKENVTITANTTESPSGIQNADTLIGNGINNSHYIYNSGYSVVSGNTYTISTYAKKNTNNFIQLQGFTSAFGVNVWANFDLNNGIVGSIGASTTAKIEDVGNGWYRCSITGTAILTTGTVDILLLVTSATSIRSETNTLSTSVNLWGFQSELGSYPTSYIPTTSATVTRNADSVSKTGISSLIGQQEGTVFIDVVVNGCQNIFANLINTERNTTASFGIIYLKASSQIAAFVYYGGSYIGTSGASIAIGQRAKIAFAYKSGNTTLYVNGVQIGTNTTAFTFPESLDDIFIGDPVTYFAYQESITNNATALFKTRLTNTQLAELTSL
jgi:hypothetical protein